MLSTEQYTVILTNFVAKINPNSRFISEKAFHSTRGSSITQGVSSCGHAGFSFLRRTREMGMKNRLPGGKRSGQVV